MVSYRFDQYKKGLFNWDILGNITYSLEDNSIYNYNGSVNNDNINRSLIDYISKQITNTNMIQKIYYYKINTGDSTPRTINFFNDDNTKIEDKNSFNGINLNTHLIFIIIDRNNFLLLSLSKNYWFVTYYERNNNLMVVKNRTQGIF